MIPTDPQDDLATAMPDAIAAPDEVDPNRPPDAQTQPAPEKETDEQWILRFLEENQHLARPRPERPPAPPPSPWDGPVSSWKVPDQLSMRHPEGGYMAMALMSRTMADLDEVTKGERAATYEEVDKYFGHALIAEGLVPFTYTADEAIHWWKSGGYKVLGGASVSPLPMPSDASQNLDPNLHNDGPAGAPHLSNAAFMVGPDGQAVSQPSPALFLRRASGETITTNDSALDEVSSIQGGATGSSVDMNANGMAIDDQIDPAQAAPDTHMVQGRAPTGNAQQTDAASIPHNDRAPVSDGGAGSDAYRRVVQGTNLEDYLEEQASHKLLPKAEIPRAYPRVQTTLRTRGEWVIAAKVEAKDLPRLARRTIVATPEMKTAAEANIGNLKVNAGEEEILAFGYLMPDGRIEVRVARGKAGNLTYRGRPSGPGKVLFGIHGHPSGDGSDGMVDAPSENDGYGDTDALFKRSIPMATVYNGKIGWHEMVEGQLIFTAPQEIVSAQQRRSLQGNLDRSQQLFLTEAPPDGRN
ncbi:hypothetical protein NDN01_24965 [Sphingomonas sp. QA11]|uniref:hypothetical protein n=1 Tax=Sphingomonas sp. QA11 TaxID=2950605 RepID=UPI00234BEA8A|nr:hypothetical protein [Sphingomonas sp. QA11]WCM27195.1 hypothetical protein NDN01_24965 [Sphingomonas sp. QA11]